MPDQIYAAYRSERGQIIFEDMLSRVRLPICLTDPLRPDNPIVYANPAFLDLTGYSRDEVIGRNCRVLQGPATTRESVEAVRRVIAARSHEAVEIVNYRKDGSLFHNALQIGPILDPQGQVVLHFGSQLDVTAQRKAIRQKAELEMKEILHRLRNIVNVMTGIVRVTAREETDVQRFAETIVGRMHALGEAHFAALASGTGVPEPETGATLGALSRTILGA